MSPSSSSFSSSSSSKPFPLNHVNIPPQFHSMTAGAGAGLVASITTCPLDVVKTRLQAQHYAKGAEGYEGVGLIIKRIWNSAGPKGFYRGLGPTLAGYLPTWGIYFTVYDLVKDKAGEWASENDYLRGNTAVVHIFAAMTAGATGTIMTNPLWVVKTRFMAQAGTSDSSSRYRTTIGAIRSIYKTEGFKAFYKGLLPSLMGVSHVAVQFPLYEKAKSWADTGEGDHSSLPPSTILACSAFSKMIASLCTYPHEVLRTRLQIRKSSESSVASTSSKSSSASNTSSLHPQSRPTKAPAPGHLHLYSPLVTGNQPPHPPLALASSSSSSSSAYSASRPPSISHPQPNPLPRIELPKPPWYKRFIHAPKPGGVIDTFLAIERQDGWRGFYRGLSINLIRTVPNSAVTMLT
ncbi:solute carrier family 25 (mitochondrial folate transporter), member 32 [Kwoniella heveanensis BCC8398]|uniref:Solute carrier family 25 (Mitochondrial folate transporter), member 32 n=1 Tax=Kwoniella heveanensis BCC8398 TaxID=1296120 RepID=A0A1B9GRQ7_9TREE|nr:solute carrier family 25 (mitochondrial folate transporter), member 32 [Kwoniella heveanensis BCC8398]